MPIRSPVSQGAAYQQLLKLSKEVVPIKRKGGRKPVPKADEPISKKLVRVEKALHEIFEVYRRSPEGEMRDRAYILYFQLRDLQTRLILESKGDPYVQRTR